MKVYFHVENVNKDSVEIRNGAETKKILKEKLKSSDNQILSYSVLNIDTISKYIRLMVFITLSVTVKLVSVTTSI